MLDNSPTTNQNPGLDAILERSARLMAHKGYHGTGMRDLAEVTGRSLSGLYHYFKSKEDLLYLINQRGFTWLLNMVNELQTAERKPAETLHSLIHDHIVYFTDHMDEMRVIIFGTLELAPERCQEINALKESYRAKVQTIVRDYIENDRGRSLSEVELTRKTFLLFGMMNWIFGWYSSGEHGSAEDLADDIFGTFTNGCSGD